MFVLKIAFYLERCSWDGGVLHGEHSRKFPDYMLSILQMSFNQYASTLILAQQEKVGQTHFGEQPCNAKWKYVCFCHSLKPVIAAPCLYSFLPKNCFICILLRRREQWIQTIINSNLQNRYQLRKVVCQDMLEFVNVADVSWNLLM